MTDVIIVHSKYGNSKNHWYEWLKHNLTLEGYRVTLFNLEADVHAQIDEWVNQMKDQIHIQCMMFMKMVESQQLLMN